MAQLQWGQVSVSEDSMAMRTRRTAGSDGDGGGPGRGGIFFPSARPMLLEPQMLQKRKAQHGECRVMFEATPLAPFEVIEPSSCSSC
jgi:hypothetical protein